MKERFKILIDKVKKLDPSYDYEFSTENITNIQIKNVCETIKENILRVKILNLLKFSFTTIHLIKETI